MSALRAIRRLRQMPASEVSARAASRLSHEVAHLSWWLSRPTWRRQDLARALDGSHGAMARVIDRLGASDLSGAHTELSRHFAERAPRFMLAPGRRAELAGGIRAAFPTATDDARRRGDRILAGRLNLLGYQDVDVTVPDGVDASVDWHRDPVHDRRPPAAHWTRVPYLDPACGDHKVIWEINRHQHWLALGRAYALSGDGRYRDRFVSELDTWMRANPPYTGINWSSMLELSLRCVSWLWALHFFVERDEPPNDRAWLVDLLLGIDRQLSLVEQNLSTYFSPNTHLIGEALALYVVGQCLPELSGARRWAALGRETLSRQADAQICEDGGHVERSPHYHRYVLDFYLLALAVARATGDADAIPIFTDAAQALARFARAMADDHFRLPCIGDDDGGMLLPMCGREAVDIRDSLAAAAVLTGAADLFEGRPPEEVAWMSGAVRDRVPGTMSRRSVALAATGYFVSRTSRGDHLVFDAGPLGFLNGGHAHADALAITLEVAGVPLLIDTGTGCYTVDPAMRDRFRSTAYHNTITVNGRSQSTPDGPFHWASAARTRLHGWRSDAAFDFVDASHDGYLPITHRRQVLARPGCWIVWDWLLGSGPVEAAAHWHLAPRWAASASGPGVRLDHPDGVRLWLLTIGGAVEVVRGGTGARSLGWCAPIYGDIVPTTTIRAVRSGTSPLSMATVILEAAEEPRIERIAEAGRPAHALALETASWREVAFARHPADVDDPEAGRGRTSAAGVESDARVAVVRHHRPTALAEVWLVDGSTAIGPDDTRLVHVPVARPTLHLAAPLATRNETSRPSLMSGHAVPARR